MKRRSTVACLAWSTSSRGASVARAARLVAGGGTRRPLPRAPASPAPLPRRALALLHQYPLLLAVPAVRGVPPAADRRRRGGPGGHRRGRPAGPRPPSPPFPL